MLRGWALAQQGQGEEGISQIRQGLAAWQPTGSELGRSHLLALLAEAYGKGGQAEAGEGSGRGVGICRENRGALL